MGTLCGEKIDWISFFYGVGFGIVGTLAVITAISVIVILL